jgi:hypothetical protein
MEEVPGILDVLGLQTLLGTRTPEGPSSGWWVQIHLPLYTFPRARSRGFI